MPPAGAVLTINLPAFQIPQIKRRILEIFSGNIETEIEGRAPVDQGYLRQHWHTERDYENDRIIIGNNTRYAAWVSRGTGIYGPYKTPVVPRTKKALKFRGQTGTLILRRCVRGMKPNPYVEKGINAGITRSMEDLNEFLGTIDAATERRSRAEVTG